jgi:hypothetical protein
MKGFIALNACHSVELTSSHRRALSISCSLAFLCSPARDEVADAARDKALSEQTKGTACGPDNRLITDRSKRRVVCRLYGIITSHVIQYSPRLSSLLKVSLLLPYLEIFFHFFHIVLCWLKFSSDCCNLRFQLM